MNSMTMLVAILVAVAVSIPGALLGSYLAQRRQAKKRLPLMGFSEMRKRYRGASTQSEKDS